jgi:hypothetical protein
MPDPLIAELPLDHLREALQRAGYSVEEVADPAVATPYRRSLKGQRVSGIRPRSPRCSASIQFGDEIATGVDGTMCLTVRCRLRFTSEDDRLADVARWQIRQAFCGPDALFAVEADLTLGSGIALADILGHGGDVYRHLRLLVADAREALHTLAVVDGASSGFADPAIRIEAKFIGDIAFGRSGLAGAHGSNISARYRRLTSGACDLIKDQLLPNLAHAVRTMILQADPSVSSGKAQAHRANALVLPDLPPASRSNARPHARVDASLDDTSIVPGLEPVR